MIKIHLPLLVRSVQFELEFDLEPCGPSCLLVDQRAIIGAIPGGMGKSPTGLSLRHAVFKTDRGTLIKRRKHAVSENVRMFGLSYQFDLDSQEEAFALVRQHRPAGVSVPLQRCPCSYEVEFVEGRLVCPASSLYHQHLAQKYPLQSFAEPSEALAFVEKAWSIVSGLHELGVRHGDPTHYNFVYADGQIFLIDLDSMMHTGETFSGWDFAIFYMYTLIPVLSEHFSVDSIREISQRIFPQIPLGTTSGCSRAFPSLLAAAYALVPDFHRLFSRVNQLELTVQSYEIHADELGRRYELERAEQLAKEGEARGLAEELDDRLEIINQLKEAADERLELINRLEGEVGELRVKGNLGTQQREALQEAADERLELINRLNGEVRELRTRDSLATHLRDLEAAVSVQVEAAKQPELKIDRVLSDAEAWNHGQLRILQLEKENAELVAQARLRVIDEQERALEAYRHRSWRWWVNRLFGPFLGVLYQYPPRQLAYPKWYTRSPRARTLPAMSIVTPSFNQGRFLERTIQSVLSQNYAPLQYIVQDGGSTDETPDVLKQYAASLAHCESVADNGQADAINIGFRHATGEIMAYLNSDDLLLPGALNYVAQFFVAHPDVDVVYGHRVVIDEYDAEIGRWVLPRHDSAVLSWADYIPQETLFWRRRIWDKVGAAIDESFRFALDWDLLLRFRDAGATFVRLPRFLGAFRVHPHQKTSAQMADLGEQEMSRLRERSLGRPVSPDEPSRNVHSYLRRHQLHNLLYRAGIARY